MKIWISLSATCEITKIREILNPSTYYTAVVEKNAHANAMAILCSANNQGIGGICFSNQFDMCTEKE